MKKNKILKNIANIQLEKSHELKEIKKNWHLLMKKFQLSNFKEKQMALKLFEFLDQFMIVPFFDKIDPIGESWMNK